MKSPLNTVLHISSFLSTSISIMFKLIDKSPIHPSINLHSALTKNQADSVVSLPLQNPP